MMVWDFAQQFPYSFARMYGTIRATVTTDGPDQAQRLVAVVLYVGRTHTLSAEIEDDSPDLATSAASIAASRQKRESSLRLADARLAWAPCRQGSRRGS